ncbi:MAG: hypothetical protein HYT72_04050 [Candidatus Aenigmarchaeota archaeon]|nr:hypothetical protein [Candidatus Aenigmarchaeota archaeon]
METPRYFLFTLALYALSFILSFVYFLIPSIQAGLFAYAEFYLITALMFLPMAFIAVYRLNLAKGHETLLRLLTTILTASLSFVLLFIILPLV